MIGSLFRILFLAVLGLVLSWAAWLFIPTHSLGTQARDHEWYLRAFPHASHPVSPARLLDSPLLGALIPVSEEALRPVASLIAKRVAVSTSLLPLWVAFFAVAILSGAILRERLHLGSAYASPTASFISKRIGELAVVVFFLWSFAPVPLPYWLFYPVLLSTTISTTAYVANLPLKV